MRHFPVAGETEPSPGRRMARRRFLGVLGAGSGVAAIAASLGGFRSSGGAVGETSGGEITDMAHPAAAHPVGGTATLHVDWLHSLTPFPRPVPAAVIDPSKEERP